MSKINLEKGKIRISDRAFKQDRQKAIRTLYEVIIEFVGNSAGSYNYQYKQGKSKNPLGEVLIEYDRSKSKPFLRVYDGAEGMSYNKLKKSFTLYRESENLGDGRNFFGRGAKDATAIGDIRVETIHENKLSIIDLDMNGDWEMQKEKTASKEERKKLKIHKKNGTVITLFIKEKKFQLPTVDSLRKYVPLHFAMNKYLHEDSPGGKVRLLEKGKIYDLIYRDPTESDVIVPEYNFEIKGYEGAKASFALFKSKNSLSDGHGSFRQNGILVSAHYGCHEKTFLDNKLNDEPLLSDYYGELKCDYISDLLNKFDKTIEKGNSVNPKNPMLVLDENRIKGLERDHPFTKELFKEPLVHLKEALAREKAKKGSGDEIGNKKTAKMLDKASKIFDEYLKDESDIETGDDLGNIDRLNKKGVMIFPPSVKIQIDEERSFTLYVKKEKLKSGNFKINISGKNLEKFIEFPKEEILLQQHSTKEDVYIAKFSIKGVSKIKSSQIIVEHAKRPLVNIPVEVYESLHRDFKKDLEWNTKHASVQYLKTKTLKVFAKYPEFIDSESEGKIHISDHSNVTLKVRSTGLFKIVKNSNYAVAEVTFEGKRLHSKTKIGVSLNGISDECELKVVDENKSNGMKIKIVNEEFGKFRARWDQTNPNLLLVAAKHPQLKALLGNEIENGEFEGEGTVQCRAILCEILAERLAWKKIELSTRKEPQLYVEWRDEKDVRNLGDDVIQKYLSHRDVVLNLFFRAFIDKSELV